MLNPVALTGIGAVMPSGSGLAPLWQQWLAGQPAFTPFHHPQLRTQRISHYAAISEPLRGEARDAVPYKLRRFGTEVAFWAVHAAGMAISDSGLDWAAIAEERRGLFSGQGDYTSPNFGSLQRAVSNARQADGSLNWQQLGEEALYRRGADPFMSIKGLANNALALTSLSWRCRGVGAAFVQNEAAGIAALRQAMFELQQGRCDVALVLATGSYNEPLTLAELLHRGLLGSAAVAQLTPFDDTAAGTVLGEGAVALLLESEAAARRRGATIHGLLHAPGCYAGPHNRIEQQGDPQGYQQALAHAQASGPQPELNSSASALLADGRGIPALDRHEAAALQALQAPAPAISSPRAITGVIPAAGALADIALASQVLRHATLPAMRTSTHANSCTSLQHAGLALHAPVHRPFHQVWCLQQGFSGFHSAVALTSAS